ncbi:hypothetical protein PTSG_08129 [Salpingoeca rosetta]|uniref:Uncharacterized protein n=1 Tax=Salpingoeca rosetta (strain ATCC 50818 / BSB-021) TaxID=946362 RepID=F2UI29_SALR5|nr:uncharacterized protein PTSG_08129 [Salpingoeca rosetta]EGD76778.1 hypothetical protein PTSG_08129 [Salpingoeca rosetta]|eukprot:XP_004991150.1 hypothetical protein PTSG_08129 [Salpingoeca rosetta]
MPRRRRTAAAAVSGAMGVLAVALLAVLMMLSSGDGVVAALEAGTSDSEAGKGHGREGAIATSPSPRLPGDVARLNAPLETTDMPDDKLVQSYRRHFAIKRTEQVKAADSIFEKPQYERRFDLVKPLLDELFRTLRASQRALEDVDVAALRPVPVDQPEVLDALLKVWENMAFFGDLILRMPDQVHTLIDNHNVRLGLVRWGVDLCLESPVYEDTHRQQLRLVLQETGLAEEKDPSYINPFSEAYIREQQRLKQQQQQQQEEHLKKTLKRQRMRKRRLRHHDL